MTPELVMLRAEETHDLRRRVLRQGTASQEVTFPQDADEATWHLGLVVDGGILAVSSWTPEPSPDDPFAPAVHLRGMAVEPSLASAGLGSTLLSAGLTECVRRGYRRVWANARDTALGFYFKAGFSASGDGYIDTTTGLPHHRIVVEL